MKKYFLLFLIILASCLCSQTGLVKQYNNRVNQNFFIRMILDSKFRYYNLSHTQKMITLINLNCLEDKQTYDLILGYNSIIAYKKPDSYLEFLDSIRFSNAHKKKCFYIAAWIAGIQNIDSIYHAHEIDRANKLFVRNTNGWRKIVDNIRFFAGSYIEDPFSEYSTNPDILWGKYFATEDPKYISGKIQDLYSKQYDHGSQKLSQLLDHAKTLSYLYLASIYDTVINEVFKREISILRESTTKRYRILNIPNEQESNGLNIAVISLTTQTFDSLRAIKADTIIYHKVSILRVGEEIKLLAFVKNFSLNKERIYDITADFRVINSRQKIIAEGKKVFSSLGTLTDTSQYLLLTPVLPFGYGDNFYTGKQTLIINLKDNNTGQKVSDTSYIVIIKNRDREALQCNEERKIFDGTDSLKIKCTCYWNGNKKRIIASLNGRLHGEQILLSKMGLPKKTRVFKDGELLTEIKYNRNGIAAKVKNFANGTRCGPSISYYKNGLPRELITYNAIGKKAGLVQKWYPNGITKDSSFYEDDKQKTFQAWYPSGLLRNYVEMKDGYINYSASFNPEGLLLCYVNQGYGEACVYNDYNEVIAVLRVELKNMYNIIMK